MKKVAEQTVIEWNLMKGSTSAGGENWLWHEAGKEKVKEWEQGGNWEKYIKSVNFWNQLEMIEKRHKKKSITIGLNEYQNQH